MMRVRKARVAWIVGAALSLVGGAAGAQSRAQPTFQVRAGVTIAPDSVRVGDPFRVTIGVRAPAGAAIEFPRALDTTAAVQSLDPVQVRTSADTTVTEQYGDYRVAAWDIGKQPIRVEDVLVRYDGVVRRVSIVGESVFVKSVLPADSTKRIPKPPRPLIELSAIPWWLWALIAAAVIAIGLLLWWWLHRRKTPPAAVVVDPFGRAEKEFQRIEALGLLDAGERGRYVTLMIEVLRDYLAARYAEAMLSLTRSELQRTVRDLAHVPQDRLTRLLTDADLIKFARRPVSGERARELGREARAIVALEHQASMPAPAEQE
ncbi:MAG TPA: hypothetical protein VLN49_22105, partial [Gemmatimonadaceae bacterium]|nr:hypothetical protein [Gemmatimonadaceae bacterium]